MEGTTLEGHPVDHQHVVSGTRRTQKHALQCPNLKWQNFWEVAGSQWQREEKDIETDRDREFWIPIGGRGIVRGNMPTGRVLALRPVAPRQVSRHSDPFQRSKTKFI